MTTNFLTHLDEIESTNEWMLQSLKQNKNLNHGDMVMADFQSNGRGQMNNHWESERGKNLLCSIILFPKRMQANAQFPISEAVALAVADYLDIRSSFISVKWPNDIYWNDKKIAGILIENNLSGNYLSDCIVGIGLNLNQSEFKSDAPNPISLNTITKRFFDPKTAAKRIRIHLMSRFWQAENTPDILHEEYLKKLYRRDITATYKDANGTFIGVITDVETTGHIVIKDESGNLRRYAFKEVQFVL